MFCLSCQASGAGGWGGGVKTGLSSITHGWPGPSPLTITSRPLVCSVLCRAWAGDARNTKSASIDFLLGGGGRGGRLLQGGGVDCPHQTPLLFPPSLLLLHSPFHLAALEGRCVCQPGTGASLSLSFTHLLLLLLLLFLFSPPLNLIRVPLYTAPFTEMFLNHSDKPKASCINQDWVGHGVTSQLLLNTESHIHHFSLITLIKRRSPRPLS